MKIDKSEKQELIEKFNLLTQKHLQFQQEINDLRNQINSFQITERDEEVESKSEPLKTVSSDPVQREEKEVRSKPARKSIVEKAGNETRTIKTGFSSEIEKFIGENLINKIGIVVIIIGVGIGTKYAIDKDLISPLVRIVLGYLLGFVLTGFAIYLKKKYLNFSAVLFSGAMAIHFFITYAAYSYYSFYPHVLAFALMVLITVLTVGLALYYNRQVIAHIGLAGAYIVPFLLEDPDSSILVLLTYMTIINCGILFISTKKQWKPLNYLALISTWVIFMSWFSSKNYDNELGLSLTFSSIFFVIFYLVFLSYKLILKEKFRIDDIIFLLLNSGMFYFVGMIALEMADLITEYAGLFTTINAVIHGFTAWVIYRAEQKGKNLFYWTIGMVIAFLTVTVVVQFNDYYTAILWSVEAALIYLYGKSRKIKFYEILSYVVILLSAAITVINWSTVSYNLYRGDIEKLFTPIFNMEFLSSIIVILSFCFIFYVNLKSKINSGKERHTSDFFDIALPLLLLFIIYFTFYTEISMYWNNVQINTSYELTSNGVWEKQFDKLNLDVTKFMVIWLLNYTLLYVSILSFINFRWFKNKNFDAFILVINFFVILVFLGTGLNQLAQLRESYLSTDLPLNYDVSIYHLLIRYISFAFFALILYSTFYFVITRMKVNVFKNIFEIVLCGSIVWISSSELIQWLHLSGSTEVYKHGLSILWGVFSLIFIVYGIWKKKKHIRISAIVLLGATLIKLFFYDLTNLKTIPKTIVFISIGILFLVISFLYNKYKNTIYTEN